MRPDAGRNLNTTIPELNSFTCPFYCLVGVRESVDFV